MAGRGRSFWKGARSSLGGRTPQQVTITHALLVAAIIFAAGLTQGLTGFGSALVAMPLLTNLIHVRVAASLMSMTSFILQITILLRYRQHLEWRAVIRLLVGSWVAVPLGVYGLRLLNEGIVTAILGLVIVGYGLYALFTPRLPRIRDVRWGYLFGFASGLLSGAYNASGPPVVIYGTARRWGPDEFKGNLQGFFMLNNLAVILSHAVAGDMTPMVWQHALVAFPAVILGGLAGLSLDRYINPATFRRIVLWALIVLGVRLIVV